MPGPRDKVLELQEFDDITAHEGFLRYCKVLGLVDVEVELFSAMEIHEQSLSGCPDVVDATDHELEMTINTLYFF